jgi:hypothetical protein
MSAQLHQTRILILHISPCNQTVGLRDRFDNNWNFEREEDARWEHGMAATGNGENLDLLANVGCRYRF